MKKKLKKTHKIIIIILIILVLLFLWISIPRVLTLNKNPSCFFTGGIWKYFSNTCVDSCGLPENPICGQSFTWGCDCGTFKCWNYEKGRCQLNS